MRKFLLYSSALVVLSGGVEAACIQTPSCSSLGYTSTTACEGGLKCPWGNAWFCNIGNGNTTPTPDYSNCKIGDILYSDMSCNANVIASKTPIGVVFDTTNHLAVAKNAFTNLTWSYEEKDISGITNYSSFSAATADWQGFKNTMAIYETDKTGELYPAIKKVLTYSTAGTQQGQWYIPAAGELAMLDKNKDKINSALSLIGGKYEIGWSSSEADKSYAFNNNTKNKKSNTGSVQPIINYASTQKIEFAFEDAKCQIGDILYSDKKCHLWAPDKTPIAIVFDAEKRRAMASTLYGKCSWGAPTNIPELPGIKSEAEALKDWNGKENTKKFLNACSGSDYCGYAIEYVNNYKTEGTQAGDWYLPAIGELNAIYNNFEVLNNTMRQTFSKEFSNDISLWSSTEIGGFMIWIFEITDGRITSWYKEYETSYVLPVLTF